jgi:hypothetical protein
MYRQKFVERMPADIVRISRWHTSVSFSLGVAPGNTAVRSGTPRTVGAQHTELRNAWLVCIIYEFVSLHVDCFYLSSKLICLSAGTTRAGKQSHRRSAPTSCRMVVVGGTMRLRYHPASCHAIIFRPTPRGPAIAQPRCALARTCTRPSRWNHTLV